MEAAAKYIESLQNNLVGQIRTHGYPDKLKSFSNRSDDYDSIRRAVDNYACAKMKWTLSPLCHTFVIHFDKKPKYFSHANMINKV